MADVDFTIQTGVTWEQSFIWQDSDGTRISLDDMAAHMQVRTAPNEAVLIDASTDNGYIRLEQDSVNADTTGIITVVLPGTVTATITKTTARYDLVLTTTSDPDGEPSYRAIEGTVTFDHGVTA